MRRLSRNYWRLAWVLFTNSLVILLFLSAPIRAPEKLLYEALGQTAPRFWYIREFFSDPWRPIIVATLLVGIVAEARRAILSPILNLSPYVAWLIMFLWVEAGIVSDPASSEVSSGVILVLAILPLTVVIVVDLVFYILAFRRRQAESTV